MIVLEVLVVAVVLFVVAAVAAGRGGGLAEAPRDGAGTGLPDGPFGAAEVAAVRFSVGRRGYRTSEVDEVLDRVAAELARRDERIRRLSRDDGRERAERVERAERLERLERVDGVERVAADLEPPAGDWDRQADVGPREELSGPGSPHR